MTEMNEQTDEHNQLSFVDVAVLLVKTKNNFIVAFTVWAVQPSQFCSK